MSNKYIKENLALYNARFSLIKVLNIQDEILK